MATLHIENTIRDYDTWKSNFDKFDRVRRDRGVTRYRVTRGAEDPTKVMVDLDFDKRRPGRGGPRVPPRRPADPQALAQLVEHRTPVVFEVMEDTALT
jgi:hypothetical protein